MAKAIHAADLDINVLDIIIYDVAQAGTVPCTEWTIQLDYNWCLLNMVLCLEYSLHRQ